MLVVIIPLIVCIIGLVLFFATKTNADLKKVGEHMFWTGLLATLLVVGGKTIHIG